MAIVKLIQTTTRPEAAIPFFGEYLAKNDPTSPVLAARAELTTARRAIGVVESVKLSEDKLSVEVTTVWKSKTSHTNYVHDNSAAYMLWNEARNAYNAAHGFVDSYVLA